MVPPSQAVSVSVNVFLMLCLSLFVMSFLLLVPDHVSTDLRIRAESVEPTLREHENAWKATNEDLLKQVELLSKEKAENTMLRWRR